MTRRLPDTSAPVWRAPQSVEALSLEIQLITPMFGGGYEPREVDADCPVRAAAVRGQLRFWWRATAGARFSSSEALFAEEEQLWGSASMPGQVRVQVSLSQRGRAVRCGTYDWDDRRRRFRSLPRYEKGWPPYALHPFQGDVSDDGQRIEQEPASAQVGLRLGLTLEFAPGLSPEHQRAAEDARNAWLRYGGLGARTRRGCGSLGWSGELGAEDRGTSGRADPLLTQLPGARFILGAPTQDPIQAWAVAVSAYRDFRQKVGFARDAGSDPRTPGRSRWPEADTIRRLTGRHCSGHAPQHRVPEAFPRADLGLPIVFHFKDAKAGDPEDATLQGSGDGASRLASPVITKALQVGGSEFRPLVMVLAAPHAWATGVLDLQCQRAHWDVPEDWIDLGPEQCEQVRPLGGKSIRQALLDYVSREWSSPVRTYP